MHGEKNILRRYLLFICLVVGLCLSAMFMALALRNTNLLHKQLLTQSRAYFKSIVLTRRWSAEHGGVYVIKRPGMESNPYLENPDIAAADGRTLTLKNPALMTREISEIAGENDLYTFHITSLNPLNPNNVPDPFETEALHSFETGLRESFVIEDKDQGARVRFIAPLLVEQACLPCHAKQGYAVGQVRGGISVSFGIDEMNRSMRQNNQVIIALGIVTVGLLLLSLWLFFRQMQRRLDKAQALLREMATVDSLTCVANRATIMARFSEGFARQHRQVASLGCLMIDVDLFKLVNDRFGHQKGDAALKELAAIVSGSLRPYDTFGRYGGEEFLMVLDGVDAKRLAEVAERTRTLVEQKLSAACGLPSPLTISLGGTLVFRGDQGIDDVIRRADQALYLAKDRGRNRVELILDEESEPVGASPC
ncbi:MAG: diguanylate cyclase [Proteobacteria bacterium]|nr:diguanylate cyclase [Pseudomonadota bacterium]